jgi:exosome complex component CSL4
MQSSSSSKSVKTQRTVLPGDRLATIEEFVPGYGSASIEGSVVATVPGRVQQDMANRVISVVPAKDAEVALPKVGDTVIGRVDSAQSSVAQITIVGLNGKISDKELSAMLSLREDRRRKTSSPVKAGDIVRAKVFSTKNSIYHLTLDAPNCGVIETVCSNCGGRVIAISKDRVKCTECGLVDERLLANDFVANSRRS